MALNFPDDAIEDQGGAQAAVVVQRSAANTMPVAARARAVLAPYATISQLQALVAGTQHIVAITNAAGRDQASAARTALVRTRTEIARRGKEARDDANAFARAVIAAERELIAVTQPEEDRLDGLVGAWEAARAAERQAKARAEEQRVAALRVRLSALQPNVRRHTTTAIRAELERITEIVVDATFAELQGEAEIAARTAVEQLQQWFCEAEAAEAAEAEAAAARAAEDARLAAERAEIAAERERQAAERRAADEAAAKVRAAQEAAQRALEAAQRRLAEDAERVAAEGRRLAAGAEAAERREAEREAAEAARIVAAMQERQRKADEADALAQRKAARRLRKQPSDDEIVRAVADAFDTDADVVRGWLNAIGKWA